MDSGELILHVDSPLEQPVPGFITQGGKPYELHYYAYSPYVLYSYIYKIFMLQSGKWRKKQHLYISMGSSSAKSTTAAHEESVTLKPQDVLMQEVIGKRAVVRISSHSHSIRLNCRKRKYTFIDRFTNFVDIDSYSDEYGHKSTTFYLRGRNIKLWNDCVTIETSKIYTDARIGINYLDKEDLIRISEDTFKGSLTTTFKPKVNYKSEQIDATTKGYLLSRAYFSA